MGNLTERIGLVSRTKIDPAGLRRPIVDHENDIRDDRSRPGGLADRLAATRDDDARDCGGPRTVPHRSSWFVALTGATLHVGGRAMGEVDSLEYTRKRAEQRHHVPSRRRYRAVSIG